MRVLMPRTREARAGLLVVALLALVVLLVWWSTPPSAPIDQGQRPDVQGPSAAVGATGGSATEPGGAVVRDVMPGALAERVSDRSTTLVVRVIERGAGTVVVNFPVVLLPEPSLLMSDARNGVSDANGQVVWECVPWSKVRVYPDEAIVTLLPGERNEHTIEVAPSPRLNGRVVDAAGQGVAGAEVWCTKNARSLFAAALVATSGDDGAFDAPLHCVGGTFLFARRVGRSPSRVEFVTFREDTREVEVELAIGGEAGAIEGIVQTTAGVPVAGATVHARGSVAALPPARSAEGRSSGTDTAGPMPPVRADAQGRFRIVDLPPGRASLAVVAEGFAGAMERGGIDAGGTTHITITLCAGARIAGTVRDTAGQPLSGVRITASAVEPTGRATTSASNGTFVLEHVSPGLARLSAGHVERGQISEERTVIDGEQVEWNPVFGAGAAIEGVLRDHRGEPVAKTNVSAIGRGGDQRDSLTDAEGRFVVRFCRETSYRLEAAPLAMGRRFVLADDVSPGTSVDLRLPELPAADAFVVGRALAPDGRPEANVSLHGEDATYRSWARVESGSDGRFRLGPLRPGDVKVTLASSTHPELQREVQLAAGQIVDLGDLQFAVAAEVDVQVRAPPGWVVAYLWGPGFAGARQRVDSGCVLLPPLGPGRYRLEIAGEFMPCEVCDLELAVGRPTVVRVDARAGMTRTLQVRLPDGVDAAALTFTAFDGAGRELVTWRHTWHSHWPPQRSVFRVEATRLVVTSADGRRGEAPLAGDDVRIELR